MDFVNAQLKQIIAQMRGLSVSGRIAVALLTAILLAGMYGMMRWGGDSEWTPVLDQALTAEQIQTIQTQLALTGVNSKIDGDRVLVAGGTDAKLRAQALLAERRALPQNTSINYAAMLKDRNPFASERQGTWLETRGLEDALSKVLSNFTGVSDAQVFVQIPQRRTIGGPSLTSSASVKVTLKDGYALDRHRVAAIGHFVVGAVPGLELKSVSISDGTRNYSAVDDGSGVLDELFERQRREEQHLVDKIVEFLGIAGVRVAAHVMLRDEDVTLRDVKHGKEVPDMKTSKSESAKDGSDASAPGVRPNTGFQLTDSSRGGSTEKEETIQSFKGDRDVKETQTVRPRGFVERLALSINIPMSYLEQVFAKQQAANNDPGNSIDKVRTAELARIADQIKPLIHATEKDQVAVSAYYDLAAEAGQGSTTQAAGLVGFAREYGAQAALLLLVLVSLALVARMALRGQAALRRPAAALAGAGGAVMVGGEDEVVTVGGGAGGKLGALGTSAGAVGEAHGAEGVLVGQEVDEQIIRIQQIVDQINDMVKSDPTAAAGLLERWVQQSR